MKKKRKEKKSCSLIRLGAYLEHERVDLLTNVLVTQVLTVVGRLDK